jgi:hypothetical protein
MRRLDGLDGVRRKRLRDGLWVQAEGTVYEDQWDDTDEDLVTNLAEYDPNRGDVFLACDDGYAGEFGEDGLGRCSVQGVRCRARSYQMHRAIRR